MMLMVMQLVSAKKPNESNESRQAGEEVEGAQ